ncbi:MAG: hypothetical protein VW338_00860 [Rhodospirillaceae bacterium]
MDDLAAAVLESIRANPKQWRHRPNERTFVNTKLGATVREIGATLSPPAERRYRIRDAKTGALAAELSGTAAVDFCLALDPLRAEPRPGAEIASTLLDRLKGGK